MKLVLALLLYCCYLSSALFIDPAKRSVPDGDTKEFEMILEEISAVNDAENPRPSIFISISKEEQHSQPQENSESSPGGSNYVLPSNSMASLTTTGSNNLKTSPFPSYYGSSTEQINYAEASPSLLKALNISNGNLGDIVRNDNSKSSGLDDVTSEENVAETDRKHLEKTRSRQTNGIRRGVMSSMRTPAE